MDLDHIVTLAEARKRTRSGTAAKEIRQRAGVTMADMAKALNVCESSISRWEGGSRQPQGDVAIHWARLLDELERINQPDVA